MIHFRTMYGILLIALMVYPWMAYAGEQIQEEKESAKKRTDLIIEYMTQNCKFKAPEIVCKCVIDELKQKAVKADYTISENDLKASLKGATEDCMVSTGFVRSMMDQASMVCYTDELPAIDAPQRTIEYLKSKYPEKVEQCTCFQKEIDKMDERTFMEFSIRAHRRYQNRVNCMKLKTKDECWKEFPDDSASKMAEIEKKCGV